MAVALETQKGSFEPSRVWFYFLFFRLTSVLWSIAGLPTLIESEDISFGDFDSKPDPEELSKKYDEQQIVIEERTKNHGFDPLPTIHEVEEPTSDSECKSKLDVGYETDDELNSGSESESSDLNNGSGSRDLNVGSNDADSSPAPTLSDVVTDTGSDTNSSIIIEDGVFYSSDENSF